MVAVTPDQHKDKDKYKDKCEYKYKYNEKYQCKSKDLDSGFSPDTGMLGTH